jgi:hypothetical protein
MSGARQAVEARDDKHVSGLEPVDHLPQPGAVAPEQNGPSEGRQKGTEKD